MTRNMLLKVLIDMKYVLMKCAIASCPTDIPLRSVRPLRGSLLSAILRRKEEGNVARAGAEHCGTQRLHNRNLDLSGTRRPAQLNRQAFIPCNQLVFLFQMARHPKAWAGRMNKLTEEILKELPVRTRILHASPHQHHHDALAHHDREVC